ncbi:hypothetical protein HYH03_007491 [Edaphochlamys debaryana]|uniref:Calmodulin n=1 Tax=Edaphochlamys debaryana TaxID=47281 RepID=A0A836C0G3_9CHLO|nr:hypothetical protein HYH03_007491 [Edaphochlamys debaryana]|eukprot:KAG2494439.1 hypothetical protein HYH03_007491 [Edaphochlamys debaryana]
MDHRHRYQVIFHTGDGWGRGCASSVSWEVLGSQGRLASSQCVQLEVNDMTTKRARAAAYAASKRDPPEWKQLEQRKAAGADGAAAPKPAEASKKPVPTGPPLEKRNVFELFSQWVQSAGGAAQVKELLKAADASGDGALAMDEVKQLLAKAVPSVSDVETQLFAAMVDVNGDGQVSEEELMQSLADCANIDAVVTAGGAAAGSGGGATSPGSPGASGGAPPGMVQTLEGLVQHLRSNLPAIDAKLLALNPVGGYLTFAQLNELFQAVVPESMGGRDALRTLLAHVARTAHITATDPGVHVLEFKRCFGLDAAATAGDGPAAAAVGWVPGRPRDVFRLLRHHVKHNRAQLDELYPRGTELTVNQIRQLVKNMLESRAGEPPLTGREARHLVAVLDANGNGLLSREEFEGGLKECRELSAAMSTVRSKLEAATAHLQEPLYAAGPGPGEEGEGGAVQPVPTWADFLACCQRVHEALTQRHEEADAAWRLNDSRGKGRIDAVELRKTLQELLPDLTPQLLRALLVFADGWDPSEHALLSRKHFLMALRGEPPPDSLQPPPPGALAKTKAADDAAGLESEATAVSLLGLNQRLAAATRALGPGLPDPQRWQTWHGNVKTKDRPSGRVALGGIHQPLSASFWPAQWKWHAAWLAKHAAYRQALAALLPPPPEPPAAAAPSGEGLARTLPARVSMPGAPVAAGAGAGAEAVVAARPQSASARPSQAGAPLVDNPANSLEHRMWPGIEIEQVPFLGSVVEREAPALATTGLEEAPPTPTRVAAEAAAAAAVAGAAEATAAEIAAAVSATAAAATAAAAPAAPQTGPLPTTPAPAAGVQPAVAAVAGLAAAGATVGAGAVALAQPGPLAVPLAAAPLPLPTALPSQGLQPLAPLAPLPAAAPAQPLAPLQPGALPPPAAPPPFLPAPQPLGQQPLQPLQPQPLPALQPLAPVSALPPPGPALFPAPALPAPLEPLTPPPGPQPLAPASALAPLPPPGPAHPNPALSEDSFAMSLPPPPPPPPAPPAPGLAPPPLGPTPAPRPGAPLGEALEDSGEDWAALLDDTKPGAPLALGPTPAPAPAPAAAAPPPLPAGAFPPAAPVGAPPAMFGAPPPAALGPGLGPVPLGAAPLAPLPGPTPLPPPGALPGPTPQPFGAGTPMAIGPVPPATTPLGLGATAPLYGAAPPALAVPPLPLGPPPPSALGPSPAPPPPWAPPAPQPPLGPAPLQPLAPAGFAPGTAAPVAPLWAGTAPGPPLGPAPAPPGVMMPSPLGDPPAAAAAPGLAAAAVMAQPPQQPPPQQQALQQQAGPEGAVGPVAAVPLGVPPMELRFPFKVHPLLLPTRVLLYEVVLAAGAQLGNCDRLTVRASGSSQPWYLEKVEVHCTTAEPPLMWEMTVRRWLGPDEAVAELRADPCVWEEWDMQADPLTGAPRSVLYLNPNMQEATWRPPPPPPVPALPGALPHQLITDLVSRDARAPGPGLPAREWLQGSTPRGVQRTGLRYLASLRAPPCFRPTRLRPHYGVGYGGELGGGPPGGRVRIKGQTPLHSLSVQARGGFKWADPDDTAAPGRLLPVTGGPGGSMYASAPPPPPSADAAAAADPFGGGLVAGVRECVVLSYSLEAAEAELGEKYLWFHAHVALDDSAGVPPAPVRFSVLKDEALVWAAWLRAAGEVLLCCESLVGCRQLHLVVESDFSGGARCVWLDPFLVCAPLQDPGVTAELEGAAKAAEELDWMARDMKVTFVKEAAGDVEYMAPSRALPPEVARSASSGSYRISVFTSTGPSSGTRGRVFVRLLGRRGSQEVKSSLICLNQDGAELREGTKYSLLEPISLSLMDEVEAVGMQFNPPPAGIMGGGTAPGGANDWNCQHVEVTCEETGKTWYFIVGGWFLSLAAQQEAERAAKAAGAGAGGTGGGAPPPRPVPPQDVELVVPRAAKGSEYKARAGGRDWMLGVAVLWIVLHVLSSGRGKGMGIDGDIAFVILGMSEQGYRQMPFSLPGRTIDQSHETRLIVCAEPLGELLSVELSCKQPGLLSTRLQCIEVVRLLDNKHYLFLPPPPDPDDPPDPAATRLVLPVARQPHWRIATFTSALPEASTDARVYIDLFGAQGQLLDLYLRDTTGETFDEGAEDVFFFPDPGLGELGSVCISHDDSGNSPNWHLDHVEVTHTGTARTFVFLCRNWLGLGTVQGPAPPGQMGRFEPDRVLERVLYPTNVLAALQSGSSLMSAHLILRLEDSTGELWHAAEAVQLVGWTHAKELQYSDTVILDSGRTTMNLEQDKQYVRTLQEMNRAAAADLREREAAAAAAAGLPVPLPPVQGAGRTFQVAVRKLAIHRTRANIAMGTAPRELVVVLHGSLASSRALLLGPHNSTNIGLAPFTVADQPDLFQLAVDCELGPALLRLDVQLPASASGSGSGGDWGMALEAVVVRDLGDAAAEPVAFWAGRGGQWLGASPQAEGGGGGGGTQSLHLLPAGVVAVSFMCRAFESVAAIHVRHDDPQAHPGWALRGLELFTSPPPGVPTRGALPGPALPASVPPPPPPGQDPIRSAAFAPAPPSAPGFDPGSTLPPGQAPLLAPIPPTHGPGPAPPATLQPPGPPPGPPPPLTPANPLQAAAPALAPALVPAPFPWPAPGPTPPAPGPTPPILLGPAPAPLAGPVLTPAQALAQAQPGPDLSPAERAAQPPMFLPTPEPGPAQAPPSVDEFEHLFATNRSFSSKPLPPPGPQAPALGPVPGLAGPGPGPGPAAQAGQEIQAPTAAAAPWAPQASPLAPAQPPALGPLPSLGPQPSPLPALGAPPALAPVPGPAPMAGLAPLPGPAPGLAPPPSALGPLPGLGGPQLAPLGPPGPGAGPVGEALEWGPEVPTRPCYYTFPGSQPFAAWPSTDRPYVRHYLTEPTLAQGYPASCYFKPPRIPPPPTRKAPLEPSPSQRRLGGPGGALLPVDPGATAALVQGQDPERLAALQETLRSEVAAYQALVAAGRGAEADLFTLMRAHCQADPLLLPGAFYRLDHDRDGRLTAQQVSELVPLLLPPEVAASPSQAAYVAAMLTLGSEERLAQGDVAAALKGSRAAYKEAREAGACGEGRGLVAASMTRLAANGISPLDLDDDDAGATELALVRLAERLVAPGSAGAAAEAFRGFDADGSGYLEIGELVKALRSIPGVQLSAPECRLLLAYLFHYGDKDRQGTAGGDMRLSSSELQASLAPFVPRPPEEEVARALTAYAATRNLPALLRALHRAQPAALPAAVAQMEARAAQQQQQQPGAGPGAVVARGQVPLDRLQEVVAAVAPGAPVPPSEVEGLRALLALDSGAGALPMEEFAAGVGSCAEAVKRAAAIARMVAEARQEGAPVVIEEGLGGAEVVLKRLSALLGADGGAAIAAAFAALDRDGSGALDGAELCSAMRQVQAMVTADELRTLLAYVQRYADTDANGRVTLAELQAGGARTPGPVA